MDRKPMPMAGRNTARRKGERARTRAAAGPSFLLLVVLLLAASCSGDERAAAISNFEEIASPPGAGSGEPNLALDGDGVLLSWLEPARVSGSGVAEERVTHDFRMARLGGEGWEEERRIVSGDNFFVNWADFPSVVSPVPGVLVAHWLVRGEAGGYDYAIHIARSDDGGRSWSEPWIPHEDGAPTEHGFVTLLPLEHEELGIIWLDGRDYVSAAAEDGERSPEMALRFRRAPVGSPPDGSPPPMGEGAGEEVVLDSRVCDCCQTSAARTSRGIVVVYRDRSADEVRDIASVRLEDGAWSEPAPVNADDWVINACPVNGPAVAASGERVAVAWFTGARDTPQVRLAFSSDAGSTFGPPIPVDNGNPAGRVATELLEDGSAIVSWLERVGEGAEVRVRRISADGRAGPPGIVASSSASRASGFPRMVVANEQLVFAWTDPSGSEGEGRVRVATAALPPLP